MRLKLLIAYDGRPFHGWQSQAGGQTVQDSIEAALAKICGTRVVLHGSGRTDAGVHALAQCAHAEVEHSRLTPASWVLALNAHLPREIRILKCTKVNPNFHARFDAKGKIYTYRIWNHPVHSPFEQGRSWHLPGTLDLPQLSASAQQLTGSHDFFAFSANRGKPDEDTVRTVTRIDLSKRGPLITLTFVGSGFLYKMVRLMTGTLIRCAQHRDEPEWISDLLACKKKTSFAAPAEGLYLTRVIY